MIYIAKAIRKRRRCNECENTIEPNEYHLRFTSWQEKINICWWCLQNFLEIVKRKIIY
jgi:hypothetical protein